MVTDNSTSNLSSNSKSSTEHNDICAGNSDTAKQLENSQKERKPWQWKPGQSGNPKGAPRKEQNYLQLMRNKLDEPCPYVVGMTWGQALIEKELSQGLDDPLTRRHVLDRIYGKAVESVKIGGDGTQVPISIVEVTLCKPSEPEGEPETKLIDNG